MQHTPGEGTRNDVRKEAHQKIKLVAQLEDETFTNSTLDLISSGLQQRIAFCHKLEPKLSQSCKHHMGSPLLLYFLDLSA